MKKKLLTITGMVTCSIVRRINRFVVEIEINGNRTYASINNTGRLKEILVEGREAYCIIRNNAGKTRFRLFAVDGEESSLIDTNLQMETFERAVEGSLIPWLNGYRILKRNTKVRRSTLDYLLINEEKEKMYVEIKSAVMRIGRAAAYPDCPSERGRRHIRELIELSKVGEETAIVFIAGLADVDYFTPAKEIDPQINGLLKEAISNGVKIKALSMYFNPSSKSIILSNPDLPIRL